MIQYTGISQSACREMALCSELSHPNVINLVEIILEDKCIFMVFEYAEHDLLQIIQHHTQPTRHPIPASAIKSILFQLLNGLYYIHSSWVLHHYGDLERGSTYWRPRPGQTLLQAPPLTVQRRQGRCHDLVPRP